MTTEKIELGATIARNANQVTSASVIQGRQEVAASGKTMPVASSSGTAAEGKKKQQLEQAVKNVSTHVQNITRELNFSVDEELGRYVVTVLDQESGEVIRQIPTEELLELAKTLAEAREDSSNGTLKGVLFQGDA